MRRLVASRIDRALPQRCLAGPVSVRNPSVLSAHADCFMLSVKQLHLIVSERKIQFHFQAKGPVANNQDWYHLVIVDDGSQSVEHQRDHINPYDTSQAKTGEKRFSLDAFRAERPMLSAELAKAIREPGNANGPKGKKRPADVIGNAIKIAGMATGEDPKDDETLSSADAEMGSKGGKARASALTPDKRAEIAMKAAEKRWKKD